MIRGGLDPGTLTATYSRRRGGLSSLALLFTSIVTLSAVVLLIVYVLFSTTIDIGRVILLTLTVAVLAPTLFTSTREAMKTFIRKMIHREPPEGDIVEIDMHEMRYFVAGEDKDVLVVSGNGYCWGRGFLILSKALPQTQGPTAERGRAEDHKMLDLFIESAYSNKLPLQSIMSLSPIEEEEAINDIPDSLNLTPNEIGRMDENKRLSMIHSRLGVWQSRMIMSTRSSPKPPSRINEVIEEVHTKLLQLKALFNAAFPDYIVERVASRREMKKTATFMLSHFEGSNLIRDGGGTTVLTGKELTEFMSIPRLIRNPCTESFPYKEFQLNPLTESDIFLGTLLDDAGNPIAQTGLRTSHLREGIAVFGDDQTQLDLTNKTIVSKIATSSRPYIVFTRETKYRPLMNLIPDAVVVELGEHFTINPLDTEGTDADQYIPLILTVFENSFPLNDEQANMLFTILHDVYAEEEMQTLQTLREHANKITTGGKETFARIRTLEGIMKTLTMLLTGNAAEALSGASTTQFKNILKASTPLVIIEFRGTTDPTVIRFIEGMIIAKLYAVYATGRDSVAPYGERMLLLEEADILFKNPSLRYIRRAVQPAETMSKWVHELSNYGVGLHITTQIPSQVDSSILARIGTKIAQRIARPDEATIASRQINLESQTAARRNQGDATPIIANIPAGEALLTRPDTRRPLPVRLMQADVLDLPFPDDTEVTRRISHILLGDAKAPGAPRTMLEIDFPDEEDRRMAKEVLKLLLEYTEFGKGTIINSFGKDEKQRVRGLLPKLESYRYITPTNIEIDEDRLRRVYRLTEKGRKAREDVTAAEVEAVAPPPTGTPQQYKTANPSGNEESRTDKGAELRPIFKGAVGGLRMARKLLKADKFTTALQRTSETLTEFINNMARRRGIRLDRKKENGLADTLNRLRDSDLPLPPNRSKITWISDRAVESKHEEADIGKEEAIEALQDAVSFLKQTAKIYHID